MNDVHTELRDLVDDITAAPRDPDRLWDTVVGLGLHTIGVPEDRGGSGGDFADLAAVVGRFAHRAASVPVAEHAVAAWASTRAGRPLPAGGPLVVVFAAGAGGPYPAVPWGRRAAGLVVVGPDDAVRYADLAGRRVEVGEETNPAGEPRDAVDAGDIPLADLAEAPDADAIRARIATLRAAALAGACAGAYELTRSYVRERRQFARPLIDIPAVAASLATMKVAGLQVQAAVDRAVDLHAGPAGPESLLAAAAVARVVAAEAADTVAGLAHRLHGAMGVTREYGLHPLTTRLWAWRDEYGDEESWARLLGTHTTDGGELDLWERLTG
ncbi:acyl-CoA dehydrogenase family protein [Embleya hyalina]|uniref:Acyl-CoA dehydrogenase n=1 Tax=Embleya hyalina TaxID=516124 RepID=A0A401YMW1_9ACTN|nr:acyl-CoA dehydrogenase family protein [Embleya hyalina]GCD95954.1 acyl-CoA dehydrogenase [Embleya hyalina]